MLHNTIGLLKKIKPGKALAAFNFSTLEVARAIIKTANSLNLPVILQTSPGETNFLSPEIAFSMVNLLSQKYQVSVALNLDHGQDLELIKRCIKSGYSSIHIDGSALNFQENVKITQAVVALCRSQGISVEAEIGQIGINLTSPQEAFEFTKLTKPDYLAVAVGEKHAMAKSKISFELLNNIVRLIKLPLVLHGGSGIDRKNLEKAINLGIRKVNFNTLLRITWVKTLKKKFLSDPEEIIPYRILPSVEEEVAKIVKEKLVLCSL